MFAVMLDLSRNGVLKVQEIKNFIDKIKIMGYDTIGLYMEDVYELDGEPYFGHMRGRYTKSELKDINAYAKKTGIKILPFIQTLAHLHGAFRWRCYADLRDADDILLIDNPATYGFIEKMFAVLRECFDCDVVNVGMDEAWNVGLGEYLKKHGFKNRIEVMYNHLLKVVEIAKKYSFECAIWSDMIFSLNSNGEDLSKYIPESLSLCYWDYYNTDEKVYDENLKKHLKVTKKTSFAGGAWTWASFAPQNRWTIKTMKPAMAACRKNGIKDVIITLWGDDGKECSYNAAMPSLFYCAEKYLYDTSDEQIKEKFLTKFGVSFDDFMCLDLPDSICGIKEPMHGTSSKFGLYQDVFLGQFDYHIDEGDGRECEKYAERLAEIARSAGEYDYLFSCSAKLCRVLALKYDLGVRTRNAYLSGDVKMLKTLADEVYPAVVERIENFYADFKILWDKECKPFGFEVQQQRIGGVIFRLRACREKLCDYLSGKIERIEELEIAVLPYDENKPKSEVFYDHRHAYIISMNREVW